ncbi:MAG: LLM class flavin-dependent oxidoreductase, partial [Propionibacteriales bacterium]|nr:LLM class flavin-dependent oxidoreductase [Propionibacteriales bacterium]
QMLAAARVAEGTGLEEIWLWEDCFAASGLAPAAAILGTTGELRVGIGLLPGPLRNPALTAMELNAVAAMFPGRFLPGMGHGVQEWMAQAGVRAESPLTLLREQVTAIRSLLHGEEVTTSGRYVHLDRVRLRFPASTVPPLLVGGRGPKTLAVAGACADGIILDDAAPDGLADAARVTQAVGLVREAHTGAGREGGFEVVTFLSTAADVTAGHLADQIRTLASAGATRIAVFAGGVDGPPASGEAILAFVDVLAEAQQLVREA